MTHLMDWQSPYTIAHIAEFCRILHVDPDRVDRFAVRLSAAAYEWYDLSHSPAYALTAKETCDELKALGRRLAALRKNGMDVSSAAWNAMQYASDCINSDHYESRIYTDAGHWRDGSSDAERHILLADHQGGHQSVTFQEVKDALKVLQNLAELGSAFVPDTRPGPSPDYPLRGWIRDMSYIVQSTGCRFTRDVSDNGTPISPAALFCVAAYAVLSPSTPPSRVLNEMKRFISVHTSADWKN